MQPNSSSDIRKTAILEKSLLSEFIILGFKAENLTEIIKSLDIEHDRKLINNLKRIKKIINSVHHEDNAKIPDIKKFEIFVDETRDLINCKKIGFSDISIQQLEQVIDVSRQIESRLGMLGASGNGLIEKATSIKNMLNKEQFDTIKKVATCRNGLKHRYEIVEKNKFNIIINSARQLLQQLKSYNNQRKSDDKYKYKILKNHKVK